MYIRFFVDSNITGYVYIRGQLLFPLCCRFISCNRANIARLQKFCQRHKAHV